MRSAKDLPPLPSVRVFEAVARLSSFRRAGDELLITQSAVSHHIRQLEAHLGTRLFERHAKSISLTPSGARYFAIVSQSLGMLADATCELTGESRRSRLRVSLLPSFAANWLIPRLADFRARHPSIEVDLDPTLRTVDLAAGEADLAIRYGDGRVPGVRIERLARERLTPILSPALAASQPLTRPSDLRAHTILLTMRETEWELWTEAAGVSLSDLRRVQLSDYNIVLQAAADGQGVAIGRGHMIAGALAAGRVCAPLDVAIETDAFAYWLLSRERRRPSEAERDFGAWLHGQFGAQKAP